MAVLASLALVAGAFAAAQNPAGGSAFVVLTPQGQTSIAAIDQGGQAMVSLQDLAGLFGLTVHEDQLAGGLTVTAGNRTIVLTPGQTLVSVDGRLVSLPAPAVRGDRGWLVPVEFISRALSLVHPTRLDVRPASRLIVVGDLRVPRVVARHEALGDRARLTFQLNPATPHTISQEGRRLVVAFQADAIDPTLPSIAPGPLVQNLTADRSAATVVVELGSGFGAYQPIEAGAAAGQFGIEILAAGASTAAPEPGPAPEPAAPDPAPLFGPDGGPVLQTIVIDPGHGGEDVGARGPSGTVEKDVTLGVARRLKALIESRLGLRVLMTREGDQEVRVDERAALANNNKADLFLSLHANASLLPAVAGAEVFSVSLDEYADEGRTLGTTASAVVPVYGGGTRTIDVIQWDMAQAGHLEASTALAQIVEERLRSRVPMSDRALQRAPFRVLVGANMPAVLVEMGFMTNPEQERQLASGDFQVDVAQSLFESIVSFRSYLEERRRQPSPVGGAAGAAGALAGGRP